MALSKSLILAWHGRLTRLFPMAVQVGMAVVVLEGGPEKENTPIVL